MNEKLNNTYEGIVEYILYLRDRNPDKDWGHIRGWTTIFSYCRWNIKYSEIEKYKVYLEEKYQINDKFIIMLREWYFGNFERGFLDNYALEFEDNYLYNFIYSISKDKTFQYDYYFCFSESINQKGYEYLLKSYKQNPNYLFTNIALGSYCQHNQKMDLAYKFYLNSLKIDKSNPYVLAKLAILFSSLGGEKNLLKAEKTMKMVLELLPDIPWANAWYSETLNMIGKYYGALKYFNKYEELTEGKHRTFEPFMRKAESYIGLGNFKKARKELNKEKEYYFGEGYRFVYNNLDEKLTTLGY